MQGWMGWILNNYSRFGKNYARAEWWKYEINCRLHFINMINGKLTLNVLQMCANGCTQFVFDAVSCSLLVYCMRSTSFLGWHFPKVIPKQEGTEGMSQFSNVLICCSEALLFCQLKSLWDVSGFHQLFKLWK